MNAALLLLLAVLALAAGYLFYGRFLSRRLGIDPARTTPAHELTDGIDYVPARAPVLFGHHFASIAGAAPIIGPVTAALFGWIPVFLWVLLGSIFLGGAHDMSSLVASIRHRGRSIGEIIEENIGVSGKTLFLLFALATLVLVVAVFAMIVARTFVATPQAASASGLFIVLAVLFGQALYRLRLPLGLLTLLGVALLFLCIWLGVRLPLSLGEGTWIAILLAYVFAASITPVWALLQPRDYLNSFLLYTLLLGALVGLVIQHPTVHLPAFTGLRSSLGYLFPVLFVTVACGAISGFHSLVSGGTTAKQLDREPDARVIGYGGMLVEGLLAVIALLAVSTLTASEHSARFAEAGPVALFSEGVGGFLSGLGIDPLAGTSFAALAVSAFALTSLDTATRLGRYAFAELFLHAPGPGRNPTRAWTQNRYLGSAVMVATSTALILSGQWQTIWPIFGSANQLLAALALLAVSVWLARRGRPNAFVRLPMYLMFAITLTALLTFAYTNLVGGKYFLGALSVVLFVLAVVLALYAVRALAGGSGQPPPGDRTGGQRFDPSREPGVTSGSG